MFTWRQRKNLCLQDINKKDSLTCQNNIPEPVRRQIAYSFRPILYTGHD